MKKPFVTFLELMHVHLHVRTILPSVNTFISYQRQLHALGKVVAIERKWLIFSYDEEAHFKQEFSALRSTMPTLYKLISTNIPTYKDKDHVSQS